MSSQGRTFVICLYAFESGVVGPATIPAEFSGVEWSCFFMGQRNYIDVKLRINGTIAAHLEEQNGIWLCHGISSGYDASTRQSRNLKKGPVPEAVNRDVSLMWAAAAAGKGIL